MNCSQIGESLFFCGKLREKRPPIRLWKWYSLGAGRQGAFRKEEELVAAKKKPDWSREEVLRRLWRIAEEAKEATWGEKQGKDGQITKEYDSKCASIELKAVEYAVRLSGLLNEEREEEIQVVLGAETKELSG